MNRNLTIVVMDNGVYQITGSQPTATSSTVDLVGVARSCGLSHSQWASDEPDFDNLFAQALSRKAPSFIAVRIDGQSGVGHTERDPVRIRDQFMRGIRRQANAK